MCVQCNNKGIETGINIDIDTGNIPVLDINRVFRYDPTRTLTLRNEFVAAMVRRFKELRGVIYQSVVDNDAFGLVERPRALLLTMPIKEYEFATDATKLAGFTEWLRVQINEGILEVYPPIGARTYANSLAWMDTYIERAWDSGERFGKSQLSKAGVVFPETGVAGLFGVSVRADRVAELYQRVFTELKGVTEAMEQQIVRVLSEGLIAGANPNQIAKLMADRVDKIGITRARAIARTEVIRAHHLANINEYEAAGIVNVTVQAEWETAQDGRVCELCAPLQGKVFTLKAIRTMIPRHPNCLTAETPILAPDKISGLVASYTGPIIEICFASGGRLSVTPNHMLLTANGLVQAQFFRKGDYIVYCPDFKTSIVGDPNNDNHPARIDNVVKTLSESTPMTAESVPFTPKDLHGDGIFCDGDVNVVWPDRTLRDARQSTILFNKVDGFNFQRAAVFNRLLGSGAFTQFLKSASFASDGIMGLSRELGSFFRAKLFHSIEHGLTSVPGSDTTFDKTPFDNPSITTKKLTKLFDGMSRVVQFDKIVNIDIKSVVGMHVYDLQSLSTLYLAGGYVSSNCRCVAVPALPQVEDGGGVTNPINRKIPPSIVASYRAGTKKQKASKQSNPTNPTKGG